MTVDVSVVIVTWNVRELALQALDSLIEDLDGSGLRYAIWVVDNASDDGTVDAVATRFPDVNLLASDVNLGFAGGNNEALRRIGFASPNSDAAALPAAVFLLNPDTITESGATRRLFDALFGEPDVGIVGAQLRYGDGSFQHGAFAFPGLRQLYAEFFPLPGRLLEGRFNGRYPRAAYERGQPFDVDFTLGATMMLRREVVLQTGMFDESYFMYCEEIDWAWRIRRAGWRALCVPEARVIHLSGQSTGQASARSIVNLWESRLQLFQRYYPAWKLGIARWMVIRGMQRKLTALPKEKLDSDIAAAYRTIIARAQA